MFVRDFRELSVVYAEACDGAKGFAISWSYSLGSCL